MPGIAGRWELRSYTWALPRRSSKSNRERQCTRLSFKVKLEVLGENLKSASHPDCLHNKLERLEMLLIRNGAKASP